VITNDFNQSQLIILTIRPIYFVAVKKAVADRYINGRFDLESHPHLTKMLECGAAARRNVSLGRHVSTLGRFPRLLHMGLHNVFNAAVILLLHQLLVEAPDETDELGISFAIAAFKSEARKGNIYADDCTRVLSDLRLLVQKLRSQIFFRSQQIASKCHSTELQNEASQYAEIYPIAPTAPQTYEWREQNIEQTVPLQVPVGEQDPAYQELNSWLNVDDLQLYNI
jgi:hypothetical protein